MSSTWSQLKKMWSLLMLGKHACCSPTSDRGNGGFQKGVISLLLSDSLHFSMGLNCTQQLKTSPSRSLVQPLQAAGARSGSGSAGSAQIYRAGTRGPRRAPGKSEVLAEGFGVEFPTWRKQGFQGNVPHAVSSGCPCPCRLEKLLWAGAPASHPPLLRTRFPPLVSSG